MLASDSLKIILQKISIIFEVIITNEYYNVINLSEPHTSIYVRKNCNNDSVSPRLELFF